MPSEWPKQQDGPHAKSTAADIEPREIEKLRPQQRIRERERRQLPNK